MFTHGRNSCSFSLDLVMEVLHSSSIQAKAPKEQARWNLQRNKPSRKQTKFRLQLSTTILNYATSIMFLQTRNLLVLAPCCTFEDNEAVIKMIIKGRCPTMRHVSRTHGVALDWLFDRINLDPKIQIKYVDTKNQLADVLTESNFTRDEWNNLLRLFNISNFSSASCPQTLSKRTQEETGEAWIMAKSRPTLNLVSKTYGSQSMSLIAYARKLAAEDWLLFLSVCCGWLQSGWKKREYGSHVEEIDETCGSWRTNVISWPRIFGMYSTWMQTNENNIAEYRKMFESWISAGAIEKLPERERNFTQEQSPGHTIWKVTRQKCVGRHCDLAI